VWSGCPRAPLMISQKVRQKGKGTAEQAWDGDWMVVRDRLWGVLYEVQWMCGLRGCVDAWMRGCVDAWMRGCLGWVLWYVWAGNEGGGCDPGMQDGKTSCIRRFFLTRDMRDGSRA
jgi:hypothetical protein